MTCDPWVGKVHDHASASGDMQNCLSIVANSDSCCLYPRVSMGGSFGEQNNQQARSKVSCLTAA